MFFFDLSYNFKQIKSFLLKLYGRISFYHGSVKCFKDVPNLEGF